MKTGLIVKFFQTFLVFSILGFQVSFVNVISSADLAEDSKIEIEVQGLVSDQKYEQDEVIVKYKDEEDIELVPLGKDSIEDKLEGLLKNKNIEYAQPNYIYETTSWTPAGETTTPDDYNGSRHWYYTQAKVPDMWYDESCPGDANCGGDSNVVVAVIDTGLAFEAFDDSAGLTGATYVASSEYSGLNLYTNATESGGVEGEDDDCNGYVDDINGVDTYASVLVGTSTCVGIVPKSGLSEDYKKAGHPVDTYGHGSIVTGNIASAVDNTSGSVSPAFNVTIMPIAANLHFSRSFNSVSLARAINYAEDNGADVINMSWGSLSADTTIKNALDSAESAGILLVAASGNTGSGYTETSVVYPAAYSNVLSVGALNSNDTRSYYSVYGNGVDIMAYVGQTGTSGGAVWQTTVSCYSSCNSGNIGSGTTEKYAIGTSFAAPQVAALAALIKTNYPSYTPTQIKNQMLNNAVDVNTTSYDTTTGWGVVDFERSLTNADTSTPTNTAPQPVYRFLHKELKVHFYTASLSERNNVISTLSDVWEYEGVAYNTYKVNISGVYRVYRFLHKDLKIHFYTSSENEKNFVLDNLSGVWEFEGGVFYTYKGTDSRPLYRFLQRELKVHFYTASESEKNSVINNLSDVWELEGIVYNVK